MMIIVHPHFLTKQKALRLGGLFKFTYLLLVLHKRSQAHLHAIKVKIKVKVGSVFN